MKFLCLHGAIANKENFSIQLHPLEKNLEKDRAAEFIYANGICDIEPPPGFQNYFGAGPHFRWIDDGGTAQESMLTRIRRLPVGDTPEDVIREVLSSAPQKSGSSWLNHRKLLEYLYAILEAEPAIQGIVGYSEGACIAGSLILDEIAKSRNGRTRQIKCAIFFHGWPPISPDEKYVLHDESTMSIDVPTLHVIGASDPYKAGGLTLYNMCKDDMAVLFDTGSGHTIPRTGLVVSELSDAVRQLINAARS